MDVMPGKGLGDDLKPQFASMGIHPKASAFLNEPHPDPAQAHVVFTVHAVVNEKIDLKKLG